MTKKFYQQDPVLTEIVNELKSSFHCHTIILYGSRARGDFTAASDYDVAGIAESGEQRRIARFDAARGVYLDIFIYPEDALRPPSAEHLIMADGVVLIEKNFFGKNFLAKLNSMLAEPESISKDELQVRKVWYQKMLARASIRDVEGKYRHIWTVFATLEDYFVFRNLRYQGPKKAFQYLQEHDSKTLSLFEKALSDTNDLTALAKLIECLPKSEL